MICRSRFVAKWLVVALIIAILMAFVSVWQADSRQDAMIEALEATGARVSSYWPRGSYDAAARRSGTPLTSWYLDRYVAHPRGIIFTRDCDTRAIDYLSHLPTIDRVTLVDIDFNSGDGRAVLDSLFRIPKIRDIQLLSCAHLAQAGHRLSGLKQVDVLANMRPEGDECAQLAAFREWRRLRALLVFEATICVDDVRLTTASLQDLRFAACTFEPRAYQQISKFSALQRLSLFQNEIADFDISALHANRELRELELTSVVVDEPGVEQLLTVLPLLRELVLPADWSLQQLTQLQRKFPHVVLRRSDDHIAQSFWGRPTSW